MRILLDEDLPRRLTSMLVGHNVSTVQRSGWTGIKNGKLLGLAAAEFDVFLTMDRNLEFQQNLAALPIAVLVVEAVSNRMEHLVPMVPGNSIIFHPSRCGRSAPNRAFESGRADKQRAYGLRSRRRAAQRERQSNTVCE